MRVEGAIDLHVHAGPDVRPRILSAVELARAAVHAGMGGFLLKSHHTGTAPVAAALSECFPPLHVRGGLALNEWVGGFNPGAVEAALRMGAAQIWMPTWSAANERSAKGQPGGLSVLDQQGSLRPALREILDLIRNYDAILGTGHLSAAEIARLVGEARQMGLRKILVTHPEIRFVNLSLQQQRELAAPEVFFERCFAREGFLLDWDGLAASIRAIGVESTVLATDLGQPANPNPVAGLAILLEEMWKRGFSQEQLETMSRRNPMRLLGLS